MNTNHQKFQRKELADFYEKLILLWENGDLMSKKFDVRIGKDYRRVKEKYDLTIKSLDTNDDMDEESLSYKQGESEGGNYICFYNSKKNLLKSYFYHMRNIAAHADFTLVKESGCNWYVFHHTFKKQLKCFGAIKSKDFWELREQLLGLKR